MIAPFRKFYGKTWVGFCLNIGKHFSQRFHLQPTERVQVLRKNDIRDFQISSPSERSACFYETISGSFGRLQYLTLK